jgi:predicted metal-dependent hydrolase
VKSPLYPADDLRRRAHAWAIRLRLNPRTVRVQAMRRKWGSCTSRGTITLAVDLVDQEVGFQDYVIVHELLHLRYASHGRVFKALLKAFVPTRPRDGVSCKPPVAKAPAGSKAAGRRRGRAGK